MRPLRFLLLLLNSIPLCYAKKRGWYVFLMSQEKKILPAELNTAQTDNAELFTKGKEFLGMFNKVMEFTKEMLQENEKLQFKLKELDMEIDKLERNKKPGKKRAELHDRLQALRSS